MWCTLGVGLGVLSCFDVLGLLGWFLFCLLSLRTWVPVGFGFLIALSVF